MDCRPARKKRKTVVEVGARKTANEVTSNLGLAVPRSTKKNDSDEVEADVEDNAEELLDHGGQDADENYNVFDDEKLCRGESFQGMDDEQKAEHIAMLRYHHVLENEGPSSDSDTLERRQFCAYLKFQPRSKTPSDSSEDIEEEVEEEEEEEDYEEVEEEYDDEEEDYEEEEEEDETGDDRPTRMKLMPMLMRPLLRSEADLKSLPKMNRYYTGFENFKAVCDLFEEVYPASVGKKVTPSTLTYRQEFTLTLVRFRLNPFRENLAEYFGIPVEKVSLIFHQRAMLMHNSPRYAVEWPHVESFTADIPQSYLTKLGRKPIVLLNIVEVDVGMPTNNKYRLRLQLYVPRKRRHCVKFVIATTVHGHIVFTGKASVGRVPDAFVIQESGVLEKLAEDPRYVIIAPRNLLRENLKADDWFVTPFAVEKDDGQPYLKPWDRLSCRKVANLAEPVNQALDLCHRKMKLFSSSIMEPDLIERISHDDLSYFDKLIKVWAALCNKCQHPLKPYD